MEITEDKLDREPAVADRNDQQPVERPEIAISVRGLRKSYGELEAMRGVDLDVERGEIFGVIGPDGAGKTSVFQILGGVMAATAGEALIFGQMAREARTVVGYLTQAFSLYQDMSVAENLRYVGRLRKLSDSQIAERGTHYLKLFDMDRFTNRLAGKLSGGMKQKLALACALITEPKVLLLDEPTTGVDPVSRREFWDTLTRLSADGMTVVVATPYLDEAERCARVALMQDGLIHQTGSPAEIRERLGLRRLEVRASELSRAEEVLSEVAEIADVQRFGDRLDVMARDTGRGELAVRDALGSAEIEVREISAGSPTLENAFVSILRDLQGEIKTPPFPQSREFRKREPGAIAIGARSLNKRFGAFHAVKDINIEVKYGEIYGLLGANGAGKTTTIKILCGMLAPSGGEMELAGERGSLRSSFVRRRIGYMSQKFSLYDDLTINDNLDFFAGVYGVPIEHREEKKRWVLEFSGLSGRGGRLVRQARDQGRDPYVVQPRRLVQKIYRPGRVRRRIGARSRASGFRTTDSRQPGLAICRRDALRAGRDRHRHVPGDVQQIAATGAIDELFCQPAAFDAVGRDDAGRGDAGMDAAVHVAQPDQSFLDDRARSLAQRRGDRGDLAAYAGAGRIRGRAGGRQRMEVPQTTWMTCDGSIHYAIVCAECCLTMPLQLPCRL